MNEEKNRKTEMPKVDVEKQIMGRIKNEHIEMKSRGAFVAEKIGFGSVLALLVLSGALAVAVIFYILKKIGAVGFLNLGMPGAKVFLLSVPFDYLVLLIITIILGSFIVQKLNFSLGVKNSFSAPAAVLLVAVIFLGAFFAFMGGENFLKDFYAERKIPSEIAISGKIMEVSGEEVVIQKQDGSLKTIIFGEGKIFPYIPEYAVGKNMQAVGLQDSQNPALFHAEEINCCE